MRSAVLLDTHAWAWTLTDDLRLTSMARRAIENAESVFVSPISFFEIGQKVRLGKWPEMAPHVARLSDTLVKQGGSVAPLSPDICLEAAGMTWLHRDPFDRLIASTTAAMALTLISADQVFDTVEGLSSPISRIW